MSLFVGVMSGTSLDGIDVVITDFSDTDRIKLLAAETFPFTNGLAHKLTQIIESAHTSLVQFGQLDIELGHAIANAINSLLQQYKIDAADIVAIGSHGQTLYHAPTSDFPFSMQIGNGNTIAELTGITTINDFRQRDMAVGGQGAPLVPAFHQAIFSSDKIDRAIINIGGIANITRLSQQADQNALGFDSGPGNGLLNGWIKRHKDLEYDDKGNWAASGRCDERLLALLLKESYFDLTIPKSTGRELFNLAWLDKRLQDLGESIPAENVQATLVQLTVQSIANALLQHAESVQEVYLCGGGVHNDYLVTELKRLLPRVSVMSTTTLGLDPDWVEATAFAWLAQKTINRETGNLPSATGADKAVILGATYWSNELS